MPHIIDHTDLKAALVRSKVATSDPQHLSEDTLTLMLIYSLMQRGGEILMDVDLLPRYRKGVVHRWLLPPAAAAHVNVCSIHPSQPNDLPCAACYIALMYARLGVMRQPDAAPAPCAARRAGAGDADNATPPSP